MRKNTNHLTIDMALARLASIARDAGHDEVPFLAQCTSPKELQLCDILPARVGASDMFRRVSRGGVEMAQVMLYPPSEGTYARPYLTVKQASAKLEELKTRVGGSAALLADAKGNFALQLCDIQLGRHGVGTLYKRVSRGGVPVALVTFGPPVLGEVTA